MKKLTLILLICLAKGLFLSAQNPANIVIPNPTTSSPSNLTIPQYTRATTSIKLRDTIPGTFAYGGVTFNAQNLLNLNISSYPNYVNNSYSNPSTVPNFFYTNPGLVAAVTEAGESVDKTGGFNYSIPIVCSPGTQGIEPELSITYNSNSGNNWLGPGFNLSGISRITRTGKSVFFDGREKGIKFDTSDVFALDGARLLFKSGSGTYGQSGITYKTEVENYYTITSYNTQGSGPQYFIVTTPDGLTMEYGKTSTAKCLDVGNAEVLAWYISKVYDVYGNYMTYSYSNTGGEITIQSIDYTGNSNSNFGTYNKIEFGYCDRSDVNSFYIAGKEFTRKQIMKTITCKDMNGTTVRKYCFDYQYEFASLLNRVTEVDANGNSLNPTCFKWKTQGKSATLHGAIPLIGTIPNSPTPNYNMSIAAELNGDGKKDILLLNNGSTFVAKPVYNTGMTGSGYNTPQAPIDFQNTSSNTTIEGSGTVNYFTSFVMDEDDDNVDEVFVIYGIPSSITYYIKKIKNVSGTLVVSTEFTGVNPTNSYPSWFPIPNSNPYSSYYNRSRYFFMKEDVTGDNIKDVIITDQVMLYVIPGGSSAVGVSLTNIAKAGLGDFDGDGVLDIYTVKVTNTTTPSYACDVYKYDPSSNSLNVIVSTAINTNMSPNAGSWPSFFGSSTLYSYANAANSIDFGDFNGDGKTDLMSINYSSSSQALCSVLKSNGISFLADNNPLPLPVNLNGYEAIYSASDVNSDGLCDLILSSNNSGTGQSNFDCYPSNGSFLTPDMGIQTFSCSKLLAIGDFNADGAVDILTEDNYTNFDLTLNFFGQNNKKLVEEIFNIKDDIKISYAFLPGEKLVNINNVSPYYQKGATQNTNPAFAIIKPGVYVVTNKVNNNSNFDYGYYNGIYHRAGKGFLGFEKVFVRDNYKSTSGTSGTYYKGSFSANQYSATHDDVTTSEYTETYLDNNIFTVMAQYNSLYRQTVFNYTQTGSNRYLASLVSTTKDYLSSTCNVQTTNFDNNSGGNVLNTNSSNLQWVSQSNINSRQFNYTYQSLTNPLNSIPYFRKLKATEVRASPAGSLSYDTDFNYNATSGCLTSVVKNSNISSLAVTIAYSNHNAFGEPTGISISAPDLSQTRTASLQYDATGRFVTQTTNGLGLSEQAVYEPSLGNITQVSDVSGLTDKYEYDGLGRLVRSTDSRGAVNTTAYEWYSYATNFYGLKVTATLEGDGVTTSYYDCNDNELKIESSGFGGNTILAESAYDYRGMPVSRSESHFLSQTVFNTLTYVYDEYDRSQSINEVDNSSSTLRSIVYSYNALSTNGTYNKGMVKVQAPSGNGSTTLYKEVKNNEAGQTDEVNNYETPSIQNSVTFSYNQHGLPSQATTSFPGGTGGAVTYFTYDALGHQNGITDPSSGNHSYSYNSIGELVQTVDAYGQYTYVYDNVGRLLTKTGVNMGTYSYQYVTSGNGLMGLKNITGPSVISDFAYDAYNRLVEKKETVGSMPGGKQFKTTCTYNKYDQVVDYSYPNNFTITHQYDANGYLNKIKNGNTSIWELISMKSPDLVKDYKNSAGITTQLSYDNALNLQQMSLGSSSNQFFNINATSKNILSRRHQNLLSSADNNEGFDYDSFDRLKKTTFTDPYNTVITKHNYTYKANGNLDHKDDCGDYVYGNSSSPYLLTGISNAVNNTLINTVYNEIWKVSQITKSGTSIQFDFTYGNDQQRIKMEYSLNSQLQYTRWYQDNYDLQETGGGYKEWCYVYSPSGMAAVYYKTNSSAQLLNVTTDDVGSPILLTDQNGQLVEEFSYDTWGRRRNPADWSYTNVPAPQKMIRGYTGHEHIEEVGIINMNGRLYDPVMGRFSQADPILHDPSDLQSYNRFSYVMNNPANSIDPSGYDPILYFRSHNNPESTEVTYGGTNWEAPVAGVTLSGTIVDLSMVNGPSFGGGDVGLVAKPFGNGGPSGDGGNHAYKDPPKTLTSKINDLSDAINNKISSLLSPMSWFDQFVQPGGALHNTAKIINDFNPATSLLNLGFGFFTGSNIYSEKMGKSDYFVAGIGLFGLKPIGLFKAAKGGSSVIKGFTQHAAAESAITRGFKTADILKIAREGTQEVIRNGMQIRYTLQGNSIVVQQTGRNAGKVVTVFSNAPGTANGLGKGFFIPWK